MNSRLSKHHKTSLWAIVLKTKMTRSLEFTLLTQEYGILVASTRDTSTFLAYTHNISVLEIMISLHQMPYVNLHAVIQEYPFTNLNRHLTKLTRVALWQESLTITIAGGNEKHFFTLYYFFLQWLDNPQYEAHLLDTPLFYYFLLLNGVLPPHLEQEPSFASLVALSEEERIIYLKQLHKNRELHKQLYHTFVEYLPYRPRSLLQLHRYD